MKENRQPINLKFIGGNYVQKTELISKFFMFFKNIRKTKVLTGVIVVVLIIISLSFILLKKEKKEFSFAKVSRGNITQEVSETGTIKMGEEISPSFKNTGRIEKIYVKVGDNVITGQDLSKLDASQINLQLAEGMAALEVAKAKRADAQISLENAERDLSNVKDKAEEDLNNAYKDAVSVLDDAYLNIHTTFNVVYGIFSARGIKAIEKKDSIKADLEKTEAQIDIVKDIPQQENIDLALSEVKKSLESVSSALKEIRDITESTLYRDIVLDAEKSSLDTQKSNINSCIGDVIDSQQNISTTKINNKIDINTAEAKVSTLSVQLQPDGLYQAQINQAQVQVSILQKQIQDYTLLSPTDGQVTKLEKREGETVQATESVVSLLPSMPFQVKVDIYEEDIVKIQIGNPVDIKFPTLPDRLFKGKVILINPAEKLVEEVVYYEVTISFEEIPPEIKPGMSVDVAIKTFSKDNVLIIPETAVEKKDNKELVKVRKGKELQDQEVKTGAKGDDGMVEVISGLNEGEEILIK